jgi:hypothetical protein
MRKGKIKDKPEQAHQQQKNNAGPKNPSDQFRYLYPCEHKSIYGV